MLLEQELVFKCRNDGNNFIDIREMCKEVDSDKTTQLNLNQERIEGALDRYDFFQKYKFQKENIYKIKKNIRKKLKLKKEETIKKQIECLLEDGKIIPSSIKIKTHLDRPNIYSNFLSVLERLKPSYCDKCHVPIKSVSLSYQYFYTNKVGMVKKKSETQGIFDFCEKCGDFPFVRKR